MNLPVAGRRSIEILLLAMVVAPGGPQPALAQFDNPIPDTLDWRRYFPLEVGNEWHYVVGDSDIFQDPPEDDDYERWRIINASTLDGFSFFELETTVFGSVGRQTRCDTVLIRYDTSYANLLSRSHFDDGMAVDTWFMEVPCGLDGPFDILRYDCQGIDSGMEYQISGEYVARYVISSTPPDTIEVAASKQFSSLGSASLVLSDIGIASTTLERSSWRRLLIYANIGGQEYGVSAVPSSANFLSESAPVLSIETIFPNPSSTHATLVYRIGAPLQGKVDVFDMMGRRVQAHDVGFQAVGTHQLLLKWTGLATGVYTVRLRSDLGHQTSRRAVMIN